MEKILGLDDNEKDLTTEEQLEMARRREIENELVDTIIHDQSSTRQEEIDQRILGLIVEFCQVKQKDALSCELSPSLEELFRY